LLAKIAKFDEYFLLKIMVWSSTTPYHVNIDV